MNKEFEALNRNDVMSVSPDTFRNLDVSNTFKIVQLLQAIEEYFHSDTNEAALFSKGVDCEVLKLGAKGWQKGKVIITLQFCPDQTSESTSPLDDIRQNLKQTD
jgi:hypothetical protein